MDTKVLRSLLCQLHASAPHSDCTGTIETWQGIRLVSVTRCPCSCHTR